MDGLIADGIRWRIHKRNTDWMMYKTLTTDVITSGPASVVAEYCLGTVAVIPEIAADKCIRGMVVTYKKHTLTIFKYNNEYPHIVDFQYSRVCKLCEQDESEYRFGLTGFINLILTGYDEWICQEMIELIKDVDTGYGDYDKYIPCCINGNGYELAKKLLANLRSSIVGSAK